MDQLFALIDNDQMLDHAEYYFEIYPDSEELIQFYYDWLESGVIPDIEEYLPGLNDASPLN